jgi:hypothetical protein
MLDSLMVGIIIAMFSLLLILEDFAHGASIALT